MSFLEDEPDLPQPKKRSSRLELICMCLLFVVVFGLALLLIPKPPKDIKTNFCPIALPIEHKGNFSHPSVFEQPEYVQRSAKLLGGAVRVPTMSFDDMDLEPLNEPRFKVFKKLHKYLEREFPLSREFGKLEYINTYGMLYTFTGANESLKPVVLMSHQDVVPVEPSTVNEWEHGPFSGYFDGTYLHGRGSCDSKNTLLAILEATESLLEQDWRPERTLILAFGFDEEISGRRGAQKLAQTIIDRYGPRSVEVIIDEGFGMIEQWGSTIGTFTVAEKGMLDVKIELTTAGGHSSMPPRHTAIGIMAELIRTMEGNPFAPGFEDANPVLGFYRCAAEHAPSMSKELRRIILDIDAGDNRQRLIKLIESRPEMKYMIQTSQAIDVVRGGVKINALPELVELFINHRIAIEGSSASIIDRIENFCTEIARKHDISVESLGESLVEGSRGLFNITTLSVVEPAPISPSSGSVWNLLAGTSRFIFEDVFPNMRRHKGPVIVAPSVFPANTDTRHYWPLTRAIYRFSPVLLEDMVNFHTVNERLRFRSHISSVAWFYTFILNTTL